MLSKSVVSRSCALYCRYWKNFWRFVRGFLERRSKASVVSDSEGSLKSDHIRWMHHITTARRQSEEAAQARFIEAASDIVNSFDNMRDYKGPSECGPECKMAACAQGRLRLHVPAQGNINFTEQ